MSREQATIPGTEHFTRAERRIGWFTLALGLAAAACVALAGRGPAAAGVAVGALLAWISFRWLQQSLDTLVQVSVAQHDPMGQTRARIPLVAAAKYGGRYVLIGLVVYVIVRFFGVPVLSVLAGLLSLGAAAMVEGIYEGVARPV